MKKLASMKVTAFLLVAFLVLTFWGVLAQANAETAGVSPVEAADRFFGSYFVWALGIIPLPAFKALAVVASLHLVASMLFWISRGWKSSGLYLMHGALLVLLLGSLVESAVQREYYGYAVALSGSSTGVEVSSKLNVSTTSVRFYDAEDSLGRTPVELAGVSLNSSGPELVAAWPYRVQFRGTIEMSPEKSIAMYRIYYDPFHFVPYAFMVVFLLGAALHYVLCVRMARGLKVLPVVALLALAFPTDSCAFGRPVPVWENLHPDTPILVDGVVRPFDSFARGVLDDLTGRVCYRCSAGEPCRGKLTAGEVVRLIHESPAEAERLALFKVLRGDVLEALHIPVHARYVSYAALSESRGLLELYASRGDDHPATLEMRRIYANVLRYESVASGNAFSFVARSDSVGLVSGRGSAEVLYHYLNPAFWGFVAAFVACLLAALNLVFRSRKLDVAANALCMVTVAVLVLLLALRTYVAARPPMSSLYEIVLLVAFILEAFESGAFIFCKRRTFALMVPVTLMAAILLFFAKFILEPGDTFQPIPAVLNSSVFLTLHVFTIALGFAAMILSGVVAHVALFRAGRGSLKQDCTGTPLDSLLYGTLVFGAVFTVIGTLLGGVWADFAWGRFWGFDPKECGALFVILWAMLALHLRSGRLVNARTFALLNCFNIIVTFLCWFGVNLLGVGLHSYGFQNGTAAWLGVFVFVDVLFIVLIGRLVKPRAS